MSESFLRNGKSALVVLLNIPCHDFIAIILETIYCHLWHFFCTVNHLFRNKKFENFLRFVYWLYSKYSRNGFIKTFTIREWLFFVLSVFLFRMCCQSLWKFYIYASACEWLRINNKYDFQLVNRFTHCEFFKFFLTNYF